MRGCAPACTAMRAVFLFLYFIFLFFIKIYFRNPNLYEYIPAAPLPGGRDLSVKKNLQKNYVSILRGPVARERGGLGAGRPVPGRPFL